MSTLDWMFKVQDAFHAHFLIEDEPSRPGIEWSIGMKRGGEEIAVWVRGIFADDLTPETQADHQYQANTCVGFLVDQLEAGWEPEEGEQFMIIIANPT